MHHFQSRQRCCTHRPSYRVLQLARVAIVIGWLLSALGCGREIPSDRPYTIADHDRLYQQGTDLIKPFMRLHGVPPKATDTPTAKSDLRRGIQLLNEVIKINPQNWPAYWSIGKAHQALDEHEPACDAFRHAFDRQKENPDVAREYMYECLIIGAAFEAIDAAKHAVTLKPDDPGLHANLALACVFNGQFDDAIKSIDVSIAAAPDDEISQRVKQMIIDVRDGKRRQPMKLGDLE